MNKLITYCACFATILISCSIGIGTLCFSKILLSKSNSINENTNLIESSFNSIKENKPVEGFAQIDTDGSYTTEKQSVIRLTNFSEKHLYICVRALIKSRTSTDQFTSPITCDNDLSPHSTSTIEVNYNDFHNRIGDICFDNEKYNREYAIYSQALATWQTTINEYTIKSESNPIYATALQILQTRKPTEPRKVFSWNGCSFDVITALR